MGEKIIKTIVAGDREVDSYDTIERAIKASGFEITELVEGGARGADAKAREWAQKNKVPYTTFKADWKNVTREGAVVKSRKNEWNGKVEKYDAAAGTFRNEMMASYAEALVAVQTRGKTPGTQNMISLAKKYNLKIFIYEGEDADYEHIF